MTPTLTGLSLRSGTSFADRAPLAELSRPQGSRDAGACVIEATGLTKRFASKVAVDDLSFQVHAGQVTGFLGPNGAGKSTALRLRVFAFGHEYRHGTTLPTLTSVPRRSQLAVAKLAGVSALSAAVGAVCVAASALVDLVLRNRFAPGVGFADGPTLRVAAGTVLFVVLISLAGLAFGWLLRSVPAAVGLLFVLPIAVEPLLRAILSIQALHAFAGPGRYLPFTAGAHLVAYSTAVDPSVPAAFRNDLTPLVGGLTLATVLAVMLAAAFLLFRRRDA
jgi:energy-coupling factor transporter ATP-binding protein EcfA2